MILQNKKICHFQNIITIFGGTFDPIHYGHLIPVTQLAKKIGLKKIILVPNYIPPHRPKPIANIQQRIEMLKLAIKDNPLFTIDFRETKYKVPSYTITTLISFRKEIGWEKPLAFIIGEDSLLSIHTWFHWKKILHLCHLIVCTRSKNKIYFSNQIMQKWLRNHQIYNPKILNYQVSNTIYLFKNSLLNISATKIRQQKNNKKNCNNMLPQSVSNYIDKYHLYQD
ncbi:nicotinate-nucleotide adenylyltransferase [Arsenophonus symbiont of Ornithomya chloropus]|uniref:nicotinate-nucleotide adenylyltransferase n=1 Tax=Arsenophonus symbiont of Ornithomya chloropus TaxID=634121 RepID=UPI0032B2AA1C